MTDAAALLERYRQRGWKIATAESCTGGMIAAALTDIAGSSDVLERGFIAYSNEAKSELIGVPAAMIASHGAVSAPVAKAMADGALGRSRADVVISVTGIAGPGGGSSTKPVGLVYFGLARKGIETRVDRQHFAGDRVTVRLATVGHALDLLADALA